MADVKVMNLQAFCLHLLFERTFKPTPHFQILKFEHFQI
jgi:hypothetical protein